MRRSLKPPCDAWPGGSAGRGWRFWTGPDTFPSSIGRRASCGWWRISWGGRGPSGDGDGRRGGDGAAGGRPALGPALPDAGRGTLPGPPLHRPARTVQAGAVRPLAAAQGAAGGGRARGGRAARPGGRGDRYGPIPSGRSTHPAPLVGRRAVAASAAGSPPGEPTAGPHAARGAPGRRHLRPGPGGHPWGGRWASAAAPPPALALAWGVCGGGAAGLLGRPPTGLSAAPAAGRLAVGLAAGLAASGLS